MSSNQEQWYLCQLKPQGLQRAIRNLQRQGFEVFLPLVEKTRRRGSGFITERRPLFPGYIFVEFDVLNDRWQKINSTSGVTRIVSFGDQPASVPPEIIEGLKERADQSGLLSSSSTISVGSEVKLMTGPLADFVARVDQIEANRRIWVLVEILGRTTRVRVDESNWEAG